MRKSISCLCKNKGADQLNSTCKVDLGFCFDNKIEHHLFLINPRFQASDCTGQFVSDLAGNPEDRFSHVVAQK